MESVVHHVLEYSSKTDIIGDYHITNYGVVRLERAEDRTGSLVRISKEGLPSRLFVVKPEITTDIEQVSRVFESEEPSVKDDSKLPKVRDGFRDIESNYYIVRAAMVRILMGALPEIGVVIQETLREEGANRKTDDTNTLIAVSLGSIENGRYSNFASNKVLEYV